MVNAGRSRGVASPACSHPTDRCSLASFFGQLKGLAFPLVEAFGVGPVHVSAGDVVVERGDGVARTCAGAGSLGVQGSWLLAEAWRCLIR